MDDRELERLVRRVYNGLLTRGMVGTVITSTDPETRTSLRSLLSRQPVPAAPVSAR